MSSDVRRLTFALSADYAQATGGYVYDQRLLAELVALGWAITRLTLPAGFPHPDATAKTETAALLAGLPDRTLLLSDQLCVSPIPEIIAAEAGRLRFAVIVHHPLALEGRSRAAADDPVVQDERAALACAWLVIATSQATADTLMADYAVPMSKLVVAPPGTDRMPVAVGTRTGPLQLLSVGALVPRKGHDILVEALAQISDLNWQANLVGNVDRAPEHVAAVRRRIADAGLDARVTLTGELPAAALEALWLRSDLFVSASRHEGYGMAVSEALARGVPVVATGAGAIEQWLPPEAGVLIPDNDAAALAAALRALIGDRARREDLRRGALAARDRLPQWSQTGGATDAALAALS